MKKCASLSFPANKVMATFDFGTIACMREMIKRNTAGETPNTQWLTSFPQVNLCWKNGTGNRCFFQFREMQQKANGTYDRNKFDC